MASKVNTKFVVALGASLALLCGVVVVAGYFALNKSAATHEQEGSKFAAAGEWEKATGSFAKAVNKAPGNRVYLEKWIEAMGKTSPKEPLKYKERFYRDMDAALKKLAAVKDGGTDIAAHRVPLEFALRERRISASSATAWEGLVGETDAALRRIPAGTAGSESMRRYSGIGRTMMIARGYEASDADREAAKADLEAALAADPKDELAAWHLAQWWVLEARRQGTRRAPEAQAAANATAAKLVDEFVAANPAAASMVLVQAQLRRDASVRAELERRSKALEAFGRAGPSEAQKAEFEAAGQAAEQALLAEVQAAHDAALRAAEAQDPAKADEQIVVAAGSEAVRLGVDGAADRTAAMLKRIEAARPTDPAVRMKLAEFYRQLGRREEADAALQSVLDMPQPPVSHDGVLLLLMRDSAALHQADLAIAQADVALTAQGQVPAGDEAAKKEAAERYAAALKRAEDLRAKLAAERLGASDPLLLYLEGKLAAVKGDLNTARRLLTSYHEQSGWSNPESIRILAEVFKRQSFLGGAKEQVARLIEVQRERPSAALYVELADLERQTNNLRAAVGHLETAAGLDPNNANIQRQLRVTRDLVAGVAADDPYLRAMNEARALVESATPDPDKAKKLLLDKREELARERDAAERSADRYAAIASPLIPLDRAAAVAMLEQGLKDNPGNRGLQDLLNIARIEDPEAAALAQIDASPAPDFDKAAARLRIFQRVRKTREAEEAFAEMKRLDPEHPLVISRMFDEAVAARPPRVEEARALAEKAAARDMDTVGGLIFKSRLATAEGRVDDAVLLAQQAADRDKTNPFNWRLLGETRLARGQVQDAIAAMQQAMKLRGEDPSNIVGLLQALVAGRQFADALRVAREKKDFGASDPGFVELWLSLETQYGDPDVALDRRRRLFKAVPDDLANAGEFLRILLRQRQWPEARGVIEQLKEKGHADAIAPLEAAYLSAQGDRAGALAIFNAMIAKVDPSKSKGAEHIYFASIAQAVGDRALALALLEEGRQHQDPATMAADREIGMMYFLAKDWAQAEGAFRRALDSITSDPGQEVRVGLAESLLNQGKWDEAEGVLAAASTQDAPERFKVLLLRAQVATGRGDAAAARKLLDDAVATDVKNPMGYVRRAQIGLGDTTTPWAALTDAQRAAALEAVRDLEQAMSLDPANGQIRELMANTRLRQGDLDGGLAVLREGLAANPTDANLRTTLATTLNRIGRWRDAAEVLEEGASRSKEDARWSYLAGEILTTRGEHARAIGHWKKVWERVGGLGVPSQRVVARLYADSLLSQRPRADIITALEVLARPSLSTETDPALLLSRARAKMLQDDAPGAERDAAAAFTLLKKESFTEVGLFVRELARVFTVPPKEEPDAARLVAFLRAQGASTDPLRINLARLLLLAESTRAEGFSMAEALSADGQDPSSVLSAVNLLVGELYRQRAYERIVEVARRGLRVAPNDAEVNNNIAFTLARHLNRPQEALPYAEKAAAGQPRNAVVLDTLGVVHLGMGKLAEAEDAFTRARGLTGEAVSRLTPTLHLAEVKIARKDRSGAEAITREAQDILNQIPRTPENEAFVRERQDELTKLLQRLQSMT